MARADLLCELIKAGLRKDDMTFRRATQAICAEERTKQHEIYRALRCKSKGGQESKLCGQQGGFGFLHAELCRLVVGIVL